MYKKQGCSNIRGGNASILFFIKESWLNSLIVFLLSGNCLF